MTVYVKAVKNRSANPDSSRNFGYRVEVLYRPCMEDMFETLTFSGTFEALEDAEWMVERIKRAMDEYYSYPLGALDLSHWIWSPSSASPIGPLQEKPTAKPYVIPMTNRAKLIRERRSSFG